MPDGSQKPARIDDCTFYSGFGSTPIDSVRAWSGSEFLRRIMDDEIPQPSIHGTLNFRLASVSEGEVTFTGVPAAAYLNPLGTVHGGYISALLDSAMACSAHSLCPAGTGNTTVEMKISFVRPVLAGTGRLMAHGKVISSGRRITLCEGRLLDEAGKLYAHGTQTCMRIEI